MNEHVNNQNPEQSKIKTYFDLIKIVGSKGKYQRHLFQIFFLQWLVSGFLLMGTSFMFMNHSFICTGTSQVSNQLQCQSYVCSQPVQDWHKYYAQMKFQTLATQYGPFDCQKSLTLHQLRSVLYVGVLIGYIVFLSFADNIGRRTSLLLTWTVTTVSLVLVVCGNSIEMVCVGLFFAGAGCESAIRINMTILSQIVDYYKRQNYSIILNCSFGVSGILIGVFYSLLGNWRLVTILFVFLPSILVLALIYFNMYQTPKYLLRQGNYQTIKFLNEIGQINTGQPHILTYQMIANVKLSNEQNKNKIFTMTPLKLFTLSSLRNLTLMTSVIFFCITYLYSGPIVIIDKIGLSPISSQIIISSSELFAYPIAYCLIRFIPRRKSGIFFMFLSALATGLLTVIKKPSDCQMCPEGILEIVMVFCSRFCVSFYFSIFFLYVTQLFPLPARGVGFGMSSAAGALATASGQILLPYLNHNNIDPMIFFTLLALIAILAIYLLPETLNKKLQQQIKQFKTNQNLNNSKPQRTQYQFQQKGNQWTFIGSVASQTGTMYRVGSNQYRKFSKFIRKTFFAFYDKNERFQQIQTQG